MTKGENATDGKAQLADGQSPAGGRTRDVRSALVGAALAGVFTFLLLVATSDMLPIGWDEGGAITHSEYVVEWFERWFEPAQGRGSPVGRSAIEYHWYFVTNEGLPAFSRIVSATGHLASRSFVSPLTSYRVGPMALFALAVAAMFYRLRRDHGWVAACVGLGALLSLPRVFAHAHYAGADGPLLSCWTLAWAAFVPGRARWFQAAWWGLWMGLTISCKLIGCLVILPFLPWFLTRDWQTLRNLAIGMGSAYIAVFLVNPPLWNFPPSETLDVFVDLNLDRTYWVFFSNMPTMYLGVPHGVSNPHPVYNTLFWTVVTVPVGTLLLCTLGFVTVLRPGATKNAGAGWLLVCHWLILVAVRATPWVPPLEAERPILPSFPFLAAIAGVGSAALIRWATQRYGRIGRLTTAAFLALSILGSTSSVVWYAPQWLSYYNLLIGGMRGAATLGFEPTYYGDNLDREVFDWLGAQDSDSLAAGVGVSQTWRFSNAEFLNRRPNAKQALNYFDVPEFRSANPSAQSGGGFGFYVQSRPSLFSPIDDDLISSETPVFSKTIRPPNWGSGPWRLDVPIVRIYSYEQFCRAAGEQP